MIDLDLAPIAHAPDTLGVFLDALRAHTAEPLVFVREGGDAIRPGYHVTEVMATAIRSIDCGGRPEAWTETVVQLLDEGDSAARPMSVGRFLGIVGRVGAAVPLDAAGRVVLEWGRPGEPATRHVPTGVDVTGAAVVVRVGPLAATCKPRAAGACC